MVEQEHFEPEPSLARYDMEEAEISVLTQKLLKSYADRLPENYDYVAVEVSGDSEYANIGRHIERTVFKETFNNSIELMESEYGPYESASRFIISLNKKTEQPTGVLRVITHSDAGLKSWNDAIKDFGMNEAEANELPGMQDKEKVWDIGTIAVPKIYRDKSGPVSILLERAMFVATQKHKIQAIVSIIDENALKKMRGPGPNLGIPFRDLPGTQPTSYLESGNSYAVYGYLPEFFKKMDAYTRTVQGFIARVALGKAAHGRLVYGTEDDAIILFDDYQNEDA